MFKRNIKLYLDDIKDAVEKIEEYTKNLSIDKFDDDRKTVDAVVRNLEIIGEAAKNIPNEVKAKYQEIPWREMAGMRDKVIHEYFGVDVDILWKTIKEDIPQLKKNIRSVKIEIVKK